MLIRDEGDGLAVPADIHEKYLREAEELSHRGLHHLAIVIYHGLVQQDPNNPLTLLHRSKSYQNQQPPDLEAALQDAHHVVQIRPKWYQGYMQQGQILLHQGELSQARDAFKKAKENADQVNIRQVDRYLNELDEHPNQESYANSLPTSKQEESSLPVRTHLMKPAQTQHEVEVEVPLPSILRGPRPVHLDPLTLSAVPPSDASNTTRLPVGIRNLGSTGYLSVALQMLYFIKAVPKSVFRDASSKSPIIRAIQKIFYLLWQGREPVSPRDLTDALGLHGPELNEQRDFYDHFNVLLYELEMQSVNVKSVFSFKMASRIRCTHVDYATHRIESAWDLSLNVGCHDRNSGNNLRSLDQSFREYIESRPTDEDYKYDTGPCFGLQEAYFGVTLESLPDVLCLKLKRSRYFIELNRMCKIHDYWEYTEDFDASCYLNTPPLPGSEPWLYSLMTVIVHVGNNNGGKYFAVIRPSLSGPYYWINDEYVTQVPRREAFDKNFGEDYPDTKDLTMKSIQEISDRPSRTAYMLVYVRKSRAEKVLQEWSPSDVPAWLREQGQCY